jgi:hypothetical protein
LKGTSEGDSSGPDEGGTPWSIGDPSADIVPAVEKRCRITIDESTCHLHYDGLTQHLLAEDATTPSGTQPGNNTYILGPAGEAWALVGQPPPNHTNTVE